MSDEARLRFSGPHVIMFNGEPLESWKTKEKADYFAQAVIDHEKRCGRGCAVTVEYREDYAALNKEKALVSPLAGPERLSKGRA